MEVNGSQDYFVINIPQNMSSALSSIVFASFKKKKVSIYGSDRF